MLSATDLHSMHSMTFTRAHVMQVLINMIDYEMEPQVALIAPSFSVEGVDSAYGPACVGYNR